MAKNKQNEQIVDEETRVAKAQAVAETVNKQVEEDARNAEEKAIQIGKDSELLGEQVWQEKQDENPFKTALHAHIEEVQKNADGKVYVKFQAIDPKRSDLRVNYEYLPEDEFRARFVKLVS